MNPDISSKAVGHRLALALPLVAALLAPASIRAENLRMKALRDRLARKHEEKPSSPASRKWTPTTKDGTWSVPEDCAGRRFPMGKLAGKATHPHTCYGGEEFEKAASEFVPNWKFLRDCRPVDGTSTGKIEGCPPSFVGFYRPKIGKFGIEASFFGLCRLVHDNLAVAGVPLPDLGARTELPGIPATKGFDPLPAPGPINPRNPFVMAPLRETDELQGFYYGQLRDGLPHGFGFAVFPGNYAAIGFADRGLTQGWNINLEPARYSSGGIFSRVTAGDFDKGYIRRGSQTHIEPESGEPVSRIQLYQGEFQGSPHGEGVWRRVRTWGWGVREDLTFQGTLQKGKFVRGRILEGVGDKMVLSLYENSRKSPLVRWKKARDVAFGETFRYQGSFHGLSSKLADGRVLDENETPYPGDQLLELPVDLPQWLRDGIDKKALATGTKLEKIQQQQIRAEKARRAQRETERNQSWGSFFGRGTRGGTGSGGYSSGAGSSGYDSSSTGKPDIRNYKSYLDKAIRGQTSGGYDGNVSYY